MLLHTHVYLIEKDEDTLGLPHDHDTDEMVEAIIRVSAIEFAYPLDEEHTQIGTTNDRIKINTRYGEVVQLMELEDIRNVRYNADGSLQ